MGRQHFDRHRAIERLVDGLEHDSHAAGADDARDLITAESPEHRGIIRRPERIEHGLNLERLPRGPLDKSRIENLVGVKRIELATA